MTPPEIRAARKSLALTQGQLAAVMRLRAATVSDWERGIYKPDSGNELLLRAYLDGYRPADWAGQTDGGMKMTPQQRKLARHALGLPNLHKQSYRNRFFASYAPGGDYDQWAKMEDAGLAERAAVSGDGKRYSFWLTEKGARLALDVGERLCPEDFPPAPTTGDTPE